MALTWEIAQRRGQQTIGVWDTFAPQFIVGNLTLAQHQADVATILTQVAARDAQQTVWDDAVQMQNDNIAFLRDVNVRMARVIDGNLDPGHTLRRDLKQVTSIPSNSEANTLERARRLNEIWQRVNSEREGGREGTPLLLGTTTQAMFQTALDNHATRQATTQHELAELNQKRSQLKVIVEKVDRGNKRWFVAWMAFYPKGTPEHDAAESQIETEKGTLPPTARRIASLTQHGLAVQVAYVPNTGQHASTSTLLYQIAGVDTAFGHARDVVPQGQTIGPFTAGQTINVKTHVENSAGAADSDVATITLS